MARDRVLKYAPLVILAAVLLVSYWRLFVGEAFFWGLPALQFVPWRAYAFDLIRAGQFPLHNPYNGAGAPLFANYQSALLYPLNLPGLLTPSYPALGWLMSVTAVLHLFIGGWGMWLFAGLRGVPSPGRGVSALAYGLTSYIVGRLGTYPIVSAAAWLPFLLWAAARLIDGGRRRDVAWLALFTALTLTAGHAQTAWYALLLTGLYSVWLVLRENRGAWRRLLLALVGVILGAGAAGLQLMATADLLANSQRAAGYGEETAALNYSYAPLRAVNLLAPNVFGNPGDGSYLARGLFYEEAVYVGLVPLVAAVTALLAGLRRLFRRGDDGEAGAADVHYRRDLPFWAGVLVIGFIFALGRHTPIYPLLYRYVPTFSMFQAPGRWHLWTVTALSVLAGVGVSGWGAGKWVIFWTRLMTAGAVGAVVLAQLSPRLLPPDTLAIEGVQVLIREVTLTGLWVALAGLLTLLYAPNVPERFQPLPAWWGRAWAVLVLLVVAADLGWATRGLNPTLTAAFYRPLPADERPTAARGYWTAAALDLMLYGQRRTDAGDLEFVDEDALGFTPWLSGGDYRVAQDNWREFRRLNLPNMNLLDRTPLVNNFDPLLPADYAAFIDGLPGDEPALVAALGVYGVDVIYTANGAIPVDAVGDAAPLPFAPGDARPWWLFPGAAVNLVSLAVLVGLFVMPAREV